MATCYFTLNNIWTTTTTQRNISACKYVWEERGSNSRNSRAACGLKVTQRRLRKRIVSADKRWKASFRVEFLAFNKLLQPVSRNILEMLIFPPPPPSVFLSFSPEDRKNRKSGTIFSLFPLRIRGSLRSFAFRGNRRKAGKHNTSCKSGQDSGEDGEKEDSWKDPRSPLSRHRLSCDEVGDNDKEKKKRGGAVRKNEERVGRKNGGISDLIKAAWKRAKRKPISL